MVYSADEKNKISSVRWIELDKINADNDRFRITTRTDVANLVNSIQQVGLLHPLLLTTQSEENIIVAGFRRMAACRKLGWYKVPALVLSSQAGMQSCIELSISDNSLQRPLNLVETSRALGMLAELYTDTARLTKAAANLGLPDNPSIIAKLVKISDLPGPIQNGILNNTISLAMALELGQFDADTGIVVVALFEELKIGLNRQRELVLLIKEIALRENVSIADVLNADGVATILITKDLDRSIKNQRLRAYLRQRRYPSIMKAEKSFETHLKQLKLGRGLTLAPPRDFEGNTYNLSLAFENLPELVALRSKLDQLLEHPSLKKILDRAL
jgi:ParB family chromosome partitioning protein